MESAYLNTTLDWTEILPMKRVSVTRDFVPVWPVGTAAAALATWDALLDDGPVTGRVDAFDGFVGAGGVVNVAGSDVASLPGSEVTSPLSDGIERRGVLSFDTFLDVGRNSIGSWRTGIGHLTKHSTADLKSVW